jgi:TonB-linked SusC/RagA family outer membrane protein
MKIHLLKTLKKRENHFLLNENSLLRIFMVLLIYCIPVQYGNAQTGKTITGKVSDTQGETIIGASVSIRGTSRATITDVDGNFSLDLPVDVASNAVLLIKYLGYADGRQAIGNNTHFNIILKEDVQRLDEVIVVGFGTQKRVSLTGSIAAVTSDELIATKNTNVQNMMTGKLPGLRVVQNTSEPGSFTNNMDIRGLGSPLIVIDGVPRGELPRMDPNDIESISILKDASAAVYGIRASAGVVLITTKKGERGKTKIEYSMRYGLQHPSEILNPLGAHDRAVLFNETTMRNTDNPSRMYGEDYFTGLENGLYPDTDWYSLVLRKTAPEQQHNIAISGGSEKMDYYVNFGYTDQGSFFVTNSANYNRYNLRSNLNAQITKNLRASVKLNVIMDETNRQATESIQIFPALWRAKPNDPLYANDTAPFYYHPDDVYNTVTLIHPELSGHVKNKKNMFQSNAELVYDVPLVQGLSVKGMFSYDKTIDDNETYRRAFDEYRYNAGNNSYQTYTRNTPTNLRRYFASGSSSLWQLSLSYNRVFNESHNVNALVLYEENSNEGYNFAAQREFAIPIPYLAAGNSANQSGTGSMPSESVSKAYVGRFNYDYKSKYLVEFSFRRDGSSKYSPRKRYGFFPGVSAGWRVSEESFIKNNISFLQNLKLRGSYGELGNDGGLAYQFIDGFDYPITAGGYDRIGIPRGYIFGSSFVNGIGFRNAANLSTTWTTSVMKNIGLDADLWGGLLGISADIFQRDTRDILTNPDVVVPGTFGTGLSQVNLNADRNKGFEIELRHRHKVADFRYGFAGHVAMTRHMITKRLQPDRSNSYDYWRNNQINRYDDIWFGNGAAGQYLTNEQVQNSIYADGTTLPGDYIYEDWNGDGVINNEDKHPIATTIGAGDNANNLRNRPLMNFGFSIDGDYKGFDLNMLFQGAAMSYVSYGDQLLNPLSWDGNALEILFDRWHPVDPAANPYDPATEWLSGYYAYGKTRPAIDSNFAIQNGAYLRLKSIEIGYTIPKTLLSKIGAQRLRIFVNGYNLLTMTKVRGLDPEKPSENGGAIYPLNKTFNFGGNITF